MVRFLKLAALRRLLLVLMVLLPMSAHALLENLLGEAFPFEINVADNRSVEGAATGVLRTQRKESARFAEMKQQEAAAHFDLEILERWFRSEGYFDATIDTHYKDKKVIYTVKSGPLYQIETLTLKLPEGVTEPTLDELPIKKGEALNAEHVLNTTEFIRTLVLEHACLYSVDATYDAEINRETHKAFLTFEVKPSPAVVYGAPVVEGLQSIKRSFIRKYVTFKKGACFRRNDIELTRLALLQTNLFARVDVRIDAPHDGEAIVTYEVTERNHRTIKVGVGYDSNTGPGLTLGWENRNLFARGERLTIDSELSVLKKNVIAEITVPHFSRKDQKLTLRSNIEREKTDAYQVTRGEIGADLQRPLMKHLTGSVGATLEFSHQLNLSLEPTELDDTQNYSLLSYPIRLDYINSNNPLNPTRGASAGIITEPFFNLENTGNRFVKSTFAASTYLTAEHFHWHPTLAIRLATGVINGATMDDVPVTHRFYVGGGGSVRGYAYQAAGDLNEEGLPQGGLSFSEASAELRFRFNDSWGAVLFGDGGYAYADNNPSFGKDFLWGAGIGLRYFTSFAPIRVDIATPLNPREDTRPDHTSKYFDNELQLYINIGQSF